VIHKTSKRKLINLNKLTKKTRRQKTETKIDGASIKIRIKIVLNQIYFTNNTMLRKSICDNLVHFSLQVLGVMRLKYSLYFLHAQNYL